MPLLSAAELADARLALEVLLTHTCTITPMVPGTEDAEGNIPLTPGTPVTGVRCTYSTVARVVRDEGGTTLVSVPSLMVSATAAIAVGSRVSAIVDQLGNPPLGVASGAVFRVERVLDDTSGMGAPLLPTWELRAGAVSG
jgi:hypothetical protein